MKVKVNGITLNVVLEGDEKAPPVLLLHGFPDSSKLWAGQIKPLIGAGYRVIVPDLRGFGESDAPKETSAYRMQNGVDDMVTLLDELKVDKFKLVGHDFGAALAWALAITLGAERVEKLVVISVGHMGSYFSAGGINQKKASWYMLLFVQEGTAEKLLQADDWRLLKAITFPGVSDATHQAIIADLSRPGRLTAGLNWYRANHNIETFLSLDPNPDIPGVQMPTMGIWPTGDHYCLEVQMLQSEHKVPKNCWRYERLESPSHWAQRDEPEKVADLLLDFFKQDFPLNKL